MIIKMEKKYEHNIYDFSKDEMILRDFLAADRTLLANERTLLSYFRTGLGLLAIAISLIKLFDNNITYILGIIFFVSSIIPIIAGIYRYKRINKKIENLISK